MAYNEDSSASGHDEPWIQWFCGLKGHEMFCEVERSYIEDGFNLYGLRTCVSNFSDCLDLILDRIGPDDSDDSHLTQSACTLYGLIHARYIITAHGLDAMYNKYASKEFGTCPLVQCAGQPVLPVGLKDEMGADTVKIFCPKCQCVYHPPPVRSRSSHHGGAGAAGVDGAAFGTTFPHLFLMTFSNLVPDPLPQNSSYVPRVFGFRVHGSTRQRAGATSSNLAHVQSSAARQNPDNNKRSSIVGRRSESASKDSTDRKPKEDGESAELPQEADTASPQQEIFAPTNLKVKGTQSKGNDKSDNKDDESSRISKSGKRKNDGDASSKKSEANGTAIIDATFKKRRKGNNGNV
ncbi:casein kinase II regulatory subunit [Nitzschia inconspicua]|uniref:Casein kinase II subunit beta n=1 Tax=Nitzschia inconspicua TaxID=303405 RepID=A0A9K3LUJ8_9STRA|nr:casein kinase II regulatory subunit [Nitzschia inconspicua]